jgi:quercetin dioxygenase-like cupin family protein
MKRHARPGLAGAISLVAVVLSASALAGQTKGCEPVAERGGREFGCFITAREELGSLPRDSTLYWHLDEFTSRAAAEGAKADRTTVVESLGRTWLFTIAAKDWRPTRGKRVGLVGPLPLVDAPAYAAVYMEGVFRPGMESPVHRHPGVEAWYTVQGEQCVETPEGKLVQRAGGPGVTVQAGLPMRLTCTGSRVGRSVVLILQDASKPRSTPAPDWSPAGLCGP